MFEQKNVLALAEAVQEDTVALRREFHRSPELAFEEVQTSQKIATVLSHLGLNVRTSVGKTGVVGLLEGQSPGKTILLRFDMDALPVNEETGVDYASQQPGKMHACGHDGHMSVGLSLARLLATNKDLFSGTIMFVFQPAEEILSGARAMLEDGLFDEGSPDLAFGVHLWNEKPLGWFGITRGSAMAASDRFRVQVMGRRGHAAMPHQAKDPIVAATQIVSGLQTITSRNVSPLDSAVVSVATIHAGETYNTLPTELVMEGTIRTLRSSTQAMVTERFNEIVIGTAHTLGCRAEVELENLVPVLANDMAISDEVKTLAEELFPGATFDRSYCTMGSEDMAVILDEVPGCYIFVGSANKARGLTSLHHSSTFNFDESSMNRAIALLLRVIMHFSKS